MTVRGLRRIIVSVADLDRALALCRDARGYQENPDGHVFCLVR